MQRELMHDPIFLGQKSRKATKEDLEIAKDLEDALKAHRETCVGMAANMIGHLVSMICFYENDKTVTMWNPQIVKKEKAYETEEGCLSLLGAPRKTKRYQKIKVQYTLPDGSLRFKTYEGFTAQIIQHEIDHCNGILI